ncbi:hypothetical protein [Marilutibacter chinensis]|nr:hypothetical protein [Lysobacter chinensis]
MARASIAPGYSSAVDANAWAFPVAEAKPGAGDAFEASTVTQILDRYGFGIVDLVKIDIEAGERFLFAENTEWLARVNAVVIKLHARFTSGCREPVQAAIERHFGGYLEKAIGDDTFFVRRQLLSAVPLNSRS